MNIPSPHLVRLDGDYDLQYEGDDTMSDLYWLGSQEDPEPGANSHS